MTKYMYCCYGGSGSTYLAKVLMNNFKDVAVRPDTYFVPSFFPRHEVGGQYHQRLSPRGYKDFPTSNAIKGFAKRSNYQFRKSLSIEKNMSRYLKHLRRAPSLTAIFNMAPMLGFFSRHKSSDVIFIVRHPLHQYVSLTKKERHFEYVEPYGGVDTLSGIKMFVDRWKPFVKDALVSNAKIIRYEYAAEDAAKIGDEIGQMFRKWRSGARNPDVVSKSNESFLRDRVNELYKQLYPSWNI